jgi:MoxR-like ATPase
MRIGEISNILGTLYDNEKTRKRATFLLGASGVGKSAVVNQLAEARGLPVVDLRLAQCDPTDLRGVPSVEDDRTKWNVPSFFPDPEEQPKGILFLDEITSAPPAVAAIAYQLVLDRQQGEYKLPDGWMIVLAGNRQSDRGVTFAMPAPLMNRMTVLEVDTVLDDFIDYAASNGIDPRVMAFVSDRADLLHKFDKESYGKQFPTPRGWESVSNKLAIPFDAAARVELLKGDVGHEAAVAFEQFLRVWETMPSLNKIFETPDEVDVPQEINVRYCVAMGMSARLTSDNFNNAWKFLKRMPREFQTLVVKLAYQRDNSVSQATDFTEWALENREVFKRAEA